MINNKQKVFTSLFSLVLVGFLPAISQEIHEMPEEKLLPDGNFYQGDDISSTAYFLFK